MTLNHLATSPQKKSIFISHSSNEVLVAILIKDLLLSSFGNEVINVFISKEIVVGSKWLNEIGQQLIRTDLVIGLFSPQSIVRPWVNIECGYAVVAGKELLPLRINGLTRENLPSPYNDHQSDEVNKFELAERFLGAIEDKLSVKKTQGNYLENWESKFRHACDQIVEGDESLRDSKEFNWFFGMSDKTKNGIAIVQDTKGRDFRIRTHYDVGGRSFREIRCGKYNLDNIVVFNDLASLNALNRLFATFDTEFTIRCDSHTYQLMDSATDFAIGLHNGVAHRICNLSDGLVEIRFKGTTSPKKRTKSEFAFPEFQVGGEWFNHSITNREHDKQQKALILRVVDFSTGRVSFVCGGFDGQGTVGYWVDRCQAPKGRTECPRRSQRTKTPVSTTTPTDPNLP